MSREVSAGGLDERISDYGLALYDLGLGLRKAGTPIFYQPHSLIKLNEESSIEDRSEESIPSAELLEKIRPVIKVKVPEAKERKKVLFLGIYLADALNNADDIVRELSESKQHDIVQRWVALKGKPHTERMAEVTAEVITGLKPKYKILNDLLERENLDEYDYIVSIDDDIVLPKGFVDGLLTFQGESGFAIAQPARSSNSYIDHPIVEQQRGVIARETLFVETGPVVSFHRSAYDLVFPFDPAASMGYGYESVWAYGIRERGLKMGIIDAVPVDHSLRPPVTRYSKDRIEKELRDFLARYEHLPLEECFRVLDVTTVGGGK